VGSQPATDHRCQHRRSKRLPIAAVLEQEEGTKVGTPCQPQSRSATPIGAQPLTTMSEVFRVLRCRSTVSQGGAQNESGLLLPSGRLGEPGTGTVCRYRRSRLPRPWAHLWRSQGFSKARPADKASADFALHQPHLAKERRMRRNGPLRTSHLERPPALRPKSVLA
jgi:hypothetical protein